MSTQTAPRPHEQPIDCGSSGLSRREHDRDAARAVDEAPRAPKGRGGAVARDKRLECSPFGLRIVGT
jgi:hypothetical protein